MQKTEGKHQMELATVRPMKWIHGSFTFLKRPAAAQVINHTSQEIKTVWDTPW
jgi:hypothetical protein